MIVGHWPSTFIKTGGQQRRKARRFRGHQIKRKPNCDSGKKVFCAACSFQLPQRIGPAIANAVISTAPQKASATWHDKQAPCPPAPTRGQQFFNNHACRSEVSNPCITPAGNVSRSIGHSVSLGVRTKYCGIPRRHGPSPLPAPRHPTHTRRASARLGRSKERGRNRNPTNRLPLRPRPKSI